MVKAVLKRPVLGMSGLSVATELAVPFKPNSPSEECDWSVLGIFGQALKGLYMANTEFWSFFRDVDCC